MTDPSTSSLPRTALALGNFDGLHLGHRKLIEETLSIARREGLTPCVWSFREHPAVFLKGEHPGRLMSREQKLRKLKDMGIPHPVMGDFAELGSLSPEEFAERILMGQLNAAHVICGFNYTFGKNAAGNTALLRRLLERHGVHLTVIPAVEFDGLPVSSSRIRALLQEGKTEQANLLLGEPLSIEMPVEEGKHLGRAWGFPTANQSFPAHFVPLRKGVYACKLAFEGKEYTAVTNVGIRPTVENTPIPNCESHLFDFEGDLYGKTVTCRFYRFLRDEKRFSSQEELRNQIQADCAEVKQYFDSLSC